jgi:FemAB-related protein (PEP-CTERM system-associated)
MDELEVTVVDPRTTNLLDLLPGAPGATIAHEPRVLAAIGSAYKQRVELYVARRGETVEGALPIVRVRGPLGAVFSSVAYLDGGGAVGSPEACARLTAFAAERARMHGAHLELRSSAEAGAVEGFSVFVRQDKATLVRDLPPEPAAIISELDPKTRNQLRKALREGLVSETVGASKEALASFHAVYARTLRDLGSPPHSLRFFKAVAGALGARAHVARVLDASGNVLAAALVLDDRHRTSVLPWAASDRRRDALEPNTLLYFELLQSAIERGRTRFDFGRSTPGSPQWRFKERWGAKPRPLYWTTVARAKKAPPVARERGAKLPGAEALWRRLPVPLSSSLGPIVLRWLAA